MRLQQLISSGTSAVGEDWLYRLRSRKVIIPLFVLFVLLMIAVVTLKVVGPRLVRSHVLPKLEAKCRCTLTVGEINVGIGSVELVNSDANFGEWGSAKISDITAHVSFLQLVTGNIKLSEIDAGHIDLQADSDSMSGGSSTPKFLGAGSGEESKQTPVVRIRRVRVFHNNGKYPEIEAAGILAQRRADDVIVGQAREIKRGMHVASDVSGTLSKRISKEWEFDVAGGLTRGGKWGASGWISPGWILRGGTVTFQDLPPASLWARIDDVFGSESSAKSLSGVLHVDGQAREWLVTGDIEARGVRLFHKSLAADPVQIEVANAEFSLKRNGNELTLERANVQSKELEFDAVGTVVYGSEQVNKGQLSVTLPKTKCQDVIDSLPTGLAPAMRGFKLDGELDGSLSLSFSRDDIENAKLRGGVSIDNCQIVSAPAHASKETLFSGFEYKPYKSERTIKMSKDEESYTSFRRISSNFRNAVQTTEDPNFLKHNGFPRNLDHALMENIKRGKFAYGGSTITMQLARMLFLGREKTIARKVQELYFTWYLERTLNKREIMELYANTIEVGPEMFGLHEASKHYFGRSPSNLSLNQAIFIATLLPNPVRRHKQFCDRKISKWTEGKIERVIDRMYDSEMIDDLQHEEAIDQSIYFRRGKEDEKCSVHTAK